MDDLDAIIDEAERALDFEFPLTKIGLCPFCHKSFAMVRVGEINRFGFRTEIYYVEPVNHPCVEVIVPHKEKAKKRRRHLPLLDVIVEVEA